MAVKSPLTGTCVTNKIGNTPAVTSGDGGGTVGGGEAGGGATGVPPPLVTGGVVSPAVQATKVTQAMPSPIEN
jgi:hypothetical protein